MKITLRYFCFTLLITAGIWAVSCSSNSMDDGGSSDFNRVAMLENYGNNTIIPAYNDLEDAVGNLENATTAFSDDPSEATLHNLQDALKAARLAWQDASMFQFGPAESVVLRTSLNTYPTDTDRVENNIEAGNYNLGTVDNQAAIGFPTLGYLLHGTGNSSESIVDAYTGTDDAGARMQYLLDNVGFINEKVETVAAEWRADGGNYLATFVSEENAGTDVGSSLSMLINAMVLHYERFLRDGKIGIPSGVRSAGVPRPSATEAFHAGYSLELSVANIQAMQRLYAGTGLNGTDGSGLEENLEALDAQALASEITTKLNEAITSLQALNDPLAEQIENDNEEVTGTFTKLQGGVALLKADMNSVLGVTITFQDNDGD